MSIPQAEAKPIDSMELKEGDQIRVVTEFGTIYDIDAQVVIDGLLMSTVTRQPVDQENRRVSKEVYEEASILGYHGVGRIVVGRSIEVVGLNAETRERADFKTTPVHSITQIESAAA